MKTKSRNGGDEGKQLEPYRAGASLVDASYLDPSRQTDLEIPYPLAYNNRATDYDIFDQKFIEVCCRGITIYPFKEPPKVVLDLGCGAGTWALEAADRWPNSIVYGFDARQVQPAYSMFPNFYHLKDRVKWVHGNFLGGLPFPSETFDYIRAVGLGLGVPENKWPDLLIDIKRILKTDGLFELIEEDLVFPHGSTKANDPLSGCRMLSDHPLFEDPSLTPAATPSAFSYPINGSKTHLTSPIDEYFPLLRKRSKEVRRPKEEKEKRRRLSRPRDGDHSAEKKPPKRTTTIDDESFNFIPRMKLFGTRAVPVLEQQSLMVQKPSDTDLYTHPQDHTRLIASWDAMLARRFLCPNLLAILPFYLAAEFDVETLPVLRVPLPLNSDQVRPPPQNQAETQQPLPVWYDKTKLLTTLMKGSKPPQLPKFVIEKFGPTTIRLNSLVVYSHSIDSDSKIELCEDSFRSDDEGEDDGSKGLRFHSDPERGQEVEHGDARRRQGPNVALCSKISSEDPSAPPSWAPIHLARTVHTIEGCKESIWVEYKELYGHEFPPPISTIQPIDLDDEEAIIGRPTCRKRFEDEWQKWLDDMTDRSGCGFRELIAAFFGWSCPAYDSEVSFKVWRKRLSEADIEHISTLTDLCRSLRGYQCWKRD